MKNPFPIRPDTWTAVDSLGRVVPGGDLAGRRQDKAVGLFYWTWHNRPGGEATNVEKIIQAHPDAVWDYNHPVWRGVRSGHWDEPLFGFYKSYDRWVLRRHAEMLADAGVDVVIFDNTNGTEVWEKSYMALAEVFSAARADGVNAPKMAFLLPLHMAAPENNENCRVQLRSVYERFYKPGLFPDMWFYWDGKPLILAYPDGLDSNDPLEKEILDFFTFRPVQPSYVQGQMRPDHWGWLSLYPQKVYTGSDGRPEQTTVGVAQNHSQRIGLTAMSAPNAFGRTYTSHGFDSSPDAVLRGANFQEQWDYALRVDPRFIFVTGWNEWRAGRYEVWQQIPNAFPDEYNDLNSRDCEPTKGKLKDAYYYQLCANIRRYKGAAQPDEPARPTPLTLDSGWDEWASRARGYGAYRGGMEARDEYGYGNIHYTADTGRNDIVCAAVSHDKDYIYIMAGCDRDITAPGGKGWMNLLIRTRELRPQWEGYQYIVNRMPPEGETAYLEKCEGGWRWSLHERVACRLTGDWLTVRIPRAALGLDTPEFRFFFKWTDNTLTDGDIMTVYTDGDAAPGGRFMFCYDGRD